MKIESVNGRYPKGPAFVPENIEVTITDMGEDIELRLDDSSQPAFWIHLRISGIRNAVEELLKAKSSAN